MFQVLVKIDELLDMLIENPELTIGEQVTEETESLEKAPLLVRGCVLTIVDRMDEEFIKLLKVGLRLSQSTLLSCTDTTVVFCCLPGAGSLRTLRTSGCNWNLYECSTF